MFYGSYEFTTSKCRHGGYYTTCLVNITSKIKYELVKINCGFKSFNKMHVSYTFGHHGMHVDYRYQPTYQLHIFGTELNMRRCNGNVDMTPIYKCPLLKKIIMP